MKDSNKGKKHDIAIPSAAVEVVALVLTELADTIIEAVIEATFDAIFDDIDE